MARGKPIVPVSALEALARAGARGDDALVAPWMDAQRGEVFARRLRQRWPRRLIGEPTALSPTVDAGGDSEASQRAQPFRFIGDGAVRYADTITAALGPRAQIDPVVPPRSPASIGQIAAESPGPCRGARTQSCRSTCAGPTPSWRATGAHGSLTTWDALRHARSRSPPMIVERLSGDADLDAVVALEAASFTNPWTREMLARELAQPTSARVYVLRLPDARVAAFCSCWVVVDELHINTSRSTSRGAARGSATR